MAVVSVAFDGGAGGRLNAADSLTGWTASTATPVLETDFVYQGTYSISALIKNSENGYYCTTTATDMTTPKVWLCKILATNKNSLTGINLRVRVGSSLTAYNYYELFSATTYPLPGGWQIVPIDPNITGYRTSVTTPGPTLTAITTWYLRANFSNTARSENVAMDAIDVMSSGTGLTLSGGDGADTDGTFAHFVTFDEGTAANRYGIVTTKEGVLYVLGVLTIGSASATVFTDSNRTIVFPNGRFNTGFCGIDVNLAHASTAVNMSAITMVGRGVYGNDGATADTRPDFTVSNTAGVANFDTCTWNNFRAIDFNSQCAVTDSTFYQCLSITPAQGTLNNCTIEASPVTANTACVKAVDLSDISNCSFISGGAGHAIEITSATGSPFTFTGNTFSGYSGTPGSNLVANSGSDAAVIFNNTGTAITINISGGDTPSVRNGAGATTTVNSNITFTVTVQDSGANPIVGAQVAAYKTSDNTTVLASTATNASGVVTGTVPASTGAIYIRVRQSNAADAVRYYPTSTVGSIGTTNFGVTITMTEDTTVT